MFIIHYFNSVKLWKLSNMESPVQTFQGHVGIVWDVSWNSVAVDVFASASNDQTVQIWDVREEESTISLPTTDSALSLDWHPNLEYLVSVGLENGSILTYDIRASPSAPLSTMVRNVLPF